jgi:hypothetical protein
MFAEMSEHLRNVREKLPEICTHKKIKIYCTKMFTKMYKYWHNVREKLFTKGITTVLSEDRGVGIMRESKEAHV